MKIKITHSATPGFTGQLFHSGNGKTISKLKGLFLSVALTLLFLVPGMSFGQVNYYWNGGNISSNPAAGGTGTWSTTNAWRLGPYPGSGAQATWSNSNNAIFAGSPGTVTLATETVNSDSVEVTGYVWSTPSTAIKVITGPTYLYSNVNLTLLPFLVAGAAGSMSLSNVSGAGSDTIIITGTQQSTYGAATAASVNGASAGTTFSVPTKIVSTGGSGNFGYAGYNSSLASPGLTISGNIVNNSAIITCLGVRSAGVMNFSGVLSGSGNLQFSSGVSGGTGVLTLSNNNTYTGNTYFNQGNGGASWLRLGTNNALPTTTNLVMAYQSGQGGNLDLFGFNQTIRNLTQGLGSGTKDSITNNSPNSTSTLTINQSDSDAVAFVPYFVNGAGGTGHLAVVKNGSHLITLTGIGAAYTLTGGITVNAGELRFNTITSNVNISSCPVTLGGGTFGTSGIAASTTLTFGAFTLNGATVNSTISLSAGNAHTITFADSHSSSWTSGDTLFINNWQGTFGNGTSGTKGQVFFGNTNGGLTSGQLGQIVFVDGSGNRWTAQLLNTGEVVPNLEIPNVAISASQPIAGNIYQNTTNNIIGSIQLAVTTANTTLTGFTVTTSGTYTTGDIQTNGFKFWINSSNNLTGATQLGSNQAVVGSGNNVSVSGISNSLTSGNTYYILFTADVSISATVGDVMSIGTTSFNNITFTLANKTGTNPVGAGNPQTIQFQTPSIALNDNSQIGAANIQQASNGNIIDQFAIAVSLNNTSLTSVSFISGGIFVAGDLTNFKLYSGTTNSFGSATLINTVNATGISHGGTVTFNFSALTCNIGNVYFWVTTDVPLSATVGHTLTVPSLTSSAFTFSAGTVNGTISADGTQTISLLPPSITLQNNSQVGAGNINTGTNGNIISQFDVAVSTNNTSLTALSFTSGGTFTPSDLTNFELWAGTTNSFGSATLLSTVNATGLSNGATINFSSLSQTCNIGTVYFWVTVDVPGGATVGHQVSVPSLTSSAFSFSPSGTVSGTISAGGTQTIAQVPPTQLVVTSIVPTNPYVNTGFTVTVQSQTAGNQPSNVLQNTIVYLQTNTGTGNIGGNNTGTITAGTNTVVISGVTYDVAESGVSIDALVLSGDPLTDGISGDFIVFGNGDQIAVGNPYSQDFNSLLDTSCTCFINWSCPGGWKLSSDNNTVTNAPEGNININYASAVSTANNIMPTQGTTCPSGAAFAWDAYNTSNTSNRCIAFRPTPSGNFNDTWYEQLQNTGTNAISSFDISYDCKKFMNNFNNTTWRIRLYYSYDGNTWIEADSSSFYTAFAGNDGNNFCPTSGNVGVLPSITDSISGHLIPSSNIPVGGYIYFAWNYACFNAAIPGLSKDPMVGLDDVSIIAQADKPTLISPTVTAITNTGAILGATLSADGGYPISSFGTVWNTTSNVTINSNPQNTNGTLTPPTPFTQARTLSPQTKYWSAGIATNANGTGISPVDSFYTLSNPPTSAASGLTATTISSTELDLAWTAATFPGSGANATGYIIIRRQDGPDPTASGVVNGVAPGSLVLASGTILDATLNSGATVSYNDLGLNAITQYNYMIIPFTWDGANAATYNYYTPSAPTAHATTLPGAPILINPTATSITNTTAILGATITSNGGGAITSDGTVYNTNSTVTINSNPVTVADFPTNFPYVFAYTRTGFNPQTQYWYAGVALNGNEGISATANFYTLSNPPLTQASALTATGVASNQISLGWTAATFPGSGASWTGYVLLRSPQAFTPTLASTNGQAPAAGANTTIVSSTIANGTTTFLDNNNNAGLLANTTYNYLLVPFTWDGVNAATCDYLTISAPTASGTTLLGPTYYGTAGAGTWNTSNINWSPVTNGPYNQITWANGDTAVFEKNNAIVSLGSNTLQAVAIKFTKTDTLAAGANTLTLSGANPSIIINSGVTAFLRANMSASNQVILSGVGTANISGTNNFSGGMIVQNGLARLNFNSAGGSGGSGQLIYNANNCRFSNVNNTAPNEVINPNTVITVTNPILINSTNSSLFNISIGGTSNPNLTRLEYDGVISGTLDTLHLGNSLTGGGSANTAFYNQMTYHGFTYLDAGSTSVFSIGVDNALPTYDTLGIALGGEQFDMNGHNQKLYALLSSGTTPIGLDSIYSSSGNPTLSIEGAASTTFKGKLASGISLALTNANTGTLTLSDTMSYTGSTTVSGGILKLSNTGAGTLPSGNSVTINGGTLEVASNQTLNGISLSSGALKIDSGDTLIINGTLAYSGGTITDNGVLIINGSLNCATNIVSGTGKFILSNGASLEMGDPNGITSASASGNIQVTSTRTFSNSANYTYDGSAAQVTGNGLPSSINNLTVSNTGGGVTLTNSVTVNNQLTLNHFLILGNNNLVLGANALAIAGTLDASDGMIVCNNANTGIASKVMSSLGSYTLPVGDNSPTYSPISFNVTSGTVQNGAYISARVLNIKDPNNANTTNYLNRYWITNINGITSSSTTVIASYNVGDVVGAESNISMGIYQGIPWVKYSPANTVSHTITATSITTTGLFEVSGINTIGPNVSISGNTSPVCTGNSIVLTANPTGDQTYSYLWSPGGATTQSINSDPNNTTTYTVVLTDGNGFTSTATTTVTVNAMPSPVITGGPNGCDALTLNAGAGYNTYSWTDGDHTQTTTISTVGSYSVSVTVTDNNGCSGTTSMSGIIYQSPTITCTSNVTQNADQGNCNAIVNYSASTATGTPNPTITYSQNAGTSFPVGVTTVIATATNLCNTSTCSFTVTVVDNQNPVITCPTNITQNALNGNCNTLVTFSVTATDNCTASVVSSPASGSTFNVGTTTVTSTATDGNGNTATCSFTVNVVDNQSPVITCPSNIILNNDAGLCGAVVTFNVTASDNCGVSTIVSNPLSGSTFNVGINTVITTATDIYGNTSSCSFLVKVFDIESPVITCPSNITQSMDLNNCTAVVTFNVSATDNCAVSSIISNPASGTTFNAGTTTVTSSASDNHGNSSTCSFIVTVVDNQNPVINCSNDITQNAGQGNCSAIVTFVVSSTDNCSSSVTSIPASGSVFNVGTTTVTNTATDGNGNTATCSFSVSVIDNQNPVLSCPSDITQNSDVNCIAVVTFSVTATDNCSNSSIISNPASGSTFNVGTTSVNSTATDINGNTSSCSFNVTIIPTPPAQPGQINGNATVCSGTSQTYSISPVTGATSYSWTLPSGWTGSSTTTSISTTAGTIGGTISVTANNNCASSNPQTLLVTVNSVPAQPGTISGNTLVCINTSQTYSIASVSGATSYTWTIPSGWTGTSTTTSITVMAGTNGGNITVKANNACGSSPVQTLTITTTTIPTQPGVISGNTAVCQNSVQTYSIAPVTGATSYTWTLISGWTGTSTTTSITTTVGTNSGNIVVKANNQCGSSPIRTLTVIVSHVPTTPGTISGTTPVCNGTTQTYSITSVAGATSYTWTLPAGWIGTSTTTSITVTVGGTSGLVSVTANNACGSSPARTLNVTVNNVPAQPGSISGNTNICTGSSQTYTINPVSGATSYTWTLPSGWTGTSTTTSITVTSGTSSGTISVNANNNCGSGTPRTLAVTIIITPNQPGAITGNAGVCYGSHQTYSITAVPGATSYTWTIPIGWTGTSTTTSISTTVGNSSGNVTVTANNSCGISSPQILAVSSSNYPLQPGPISGNNPVCSGTTQTYSIAPVVGAASYQWILPSGWTGTSTSTSITTTIGNAGGNIIVKAVNSCGVGSGSVLFDTVKAIPVTPGQITGYIAPCNGTVQTYSVSPVAGATSYTWSLPSGWTGSSTSASITTTVGSTGGSVSVYSVNMCGNSNTPRSLTVTVSSIPNQPGTITGNAIPCQGSAQTYFISPVTGATSYTWTLPSGWSGSSTTNSISTTVGTNNGTITVVANNACGTSVSRTLSVTANSIPVQPGTINGNTTVCQGSSQTYSITPVNGAVSYIWTIPAGWIGTSTSSSITVTPNATGGNITVKATNACGTGPVQTLSVAVNTVTAVAITANPANANFCAQVSPTYVRLMASAGYNSYAWSPSGGNSQTATISTVGTYTVTATNNLGCTTTSSRPVTNNCALPTSLSTTNILGTSAKANWVNSQCVYNYTIQISVHGLNNWTSYTVTGTNFTFSGLALSTQYDWQIQTNCNTSGTINSGWSAIQTFSTLSQRIQEAENSIQFNVFPNPANNQVTIAFSSIDEGAYSINLVDMFGRIVKTETNNATSGDNQFSMNLDGVSKGMYIIIMQKGDIILKSKLVVE